MLSCLKSCIRHPKEKRNKARPVEKPPDTVVLPPVYLSHGNASNKEPSAGENVALERVAPIVDEEVSQIEEDVKAEDTGDESEEEAPLKIMGMTEENTVHAELACATIPKERKFQVVRVPGVFTRGRWKCWDYRDDVKPIEGLTFTDDKENDTGITVTASTSVSTIVSDQAATNHSPLREESSTIVVTSIAPAPPTPQHGTPSSISEMPTPPYTFFQTEHHPTTGDWGVSAPTTVTITSSQPPTTDTVLVQSVAPPASAPMTLASATPITPTPSMTSTFEVPPPAHGGQQQQQSQQMSSSSSSMVVEETRHAGDSTGSHLMSVSMSSSELGGVPSSISSSVSPPSVTTTTPSAEMTRSGSEAATQVEEEPVATAAATNNAAIDNKIEQAMDLVKTHLTFAVREEVEILRTTIAELENRVTTLETQNAYLKRHVSPEVLASLPGMIQQHKMSLPATAAPVQLQQAASSSGATSAPSSSVSPALLAAAAAAHQHHQQQLQQQHDAILEAAASSTRVHSPSQAAGAAAPTKPYCPATTNFVNSLNTVVYPPQQPPHNPR